jgi:hypothetical protein
VARVVASALGVAVRVVVFAQRITLEWATEAVALVVVGALRIQAPRAFAHVVALAVRVRTGIADALPAAWVAAAGLIAFPAGAIAGISPTAFTRIAGTTFTGIAVATIAGIAPTAFTWVAIATSAGVVIGARDIARVVARAVRIAHVVFRALRIADIIARAWSEVAEQEEDIVDVGVPVTIDVPTCNAVVPKQVEQIVDIHFAVPTTGRVGEVARAVLVTILIALAWVAEAAVTR